MSLVFLAWGASSGCSAGDAGSAGTPPATTSSSHNAAKPASAVDAAPNAVTPDAAAPDAGATPQAMSPEDSLASGRDASFAVSDASFSEANSTSQDTDFVPEQTPDILVNEDTPRVDAGPLVECAHDSYAAQRVGVNLMLLVDVSGSMLNYINDDLDDQWSAVSTALVNFVSSPSAEGLSLAIDYYPHATPRSTCTDDTECEHPLGCVTTVCELQMSLVGATVPCQDETDCLGLVRLSDGTITIEQCVQPRLCEEHATFMCLGDGFCPNAEACGEPVAEGICPGTVICDVADYETPAVARRTLPDGVDALTGSIESVIIDEWSSTPTHIAVAGAANQLRQWIAEEPDKQSFLVLATDGSPTDCVQSGQNLETLSISALQQANADGINTFVIGVVPDTFGDPQLEANVAAQQTLLQAFAAAGGTRSPTFVSADDSTAQAFLEALDAIRISVLPCEFTLPDQDTAFDQVNVEVTRGNETVVIAKVDGEADCSAEPGWYYDTEAIDANDGAPAAAVLCPSSCEDLNQGVLTQVDIILGCPTVTPRVR